MMKTELSLHERSLTLYRYPIRNNETLQAWDAGDEYLIHHVEEHLNLPLGKHILILNDDFGALSCWFSQSYKVTMMSDSLIAHQSTLNNLQHNDQSQNNGQQDDLSQEHQPQNDRPPITLLTTMDDLPPHIDLVLIKLPKSNRHLMWQLTQLRQSLPVSCPVIAVNKVKNIHTSTLKLFEQYLGTTTTSLAWKKHRLVFSTPNCAPANTTDLKPSWHVTDESIHLTNLPNVFSGDSLDLGARFFLPHIPQDSRFRHIIDLGCGNGVLAVKAGQLNPQAAITCVDESFMAVESTRQNMAHHFGLREGIECLANNCLDGLSSDSADLILCNPPFHQQNTITDHIAWQMFCDAKHVLNKQGQLLVIGNRHLGYDGKLTRIFGKTSVKTVAANKKFVILQATKV